LPQTYRLREESDRVDFQRRLDQGGKNYPWVLKKVNVDKGLGIEMLGPNSKELETALQRTKDDPKTTYIVQSYICNELTWFHGQKFDTRMYFLIASVDPLIVLYHDGLARVSAGQYSEMDFSSTVKHLTNVAFRGNETKNTKHDLWQRVREHYDTNKNDLQRRFGIKDPVVHVRSQIKEALATLVAAFKDVAFGGGITKVSMENLFAFHGCDFIIDADLDVWFIEVQTSPKLEVAVHQQAMNREIFGSMVDILEEIIAKQQNDAQANLFPLQKLGAWEAVHAGDWAYTYSGYQRSTSKKTCTPADAAPGGASSVSTAAGL
jgi:hypothetical protein